MDKPLSSKIIRGTKIKGRCFFPDVQQVASSSSDDPLLLSSSLPLNQIDNKEQKAYLNGLKCGQEQGFNTGKLEGYEEGLQESRKLSNEEFKNATLLLKMVMLNLQETKETLAESIKPEIIKLCLLICEKILKTHLKNSKHLLKFLTELVNQVASSLADFPITLALAPEDANLLQKQCDKGYLCLSHLDPMKIIIDSKLMRGNCRIETSKGLLNFDLTRLLTELELNTLALLPL